MSSVVARLRGGDLLLGGELDERLPVITDGLVAHFPMDGTPKGISNKNILDYSTWVIGSSGSQSGFSQNGDGNSIVEDLDPWGKKTAVWQTLNNDIDSNADGGWATLSFPVDNTKLYRFSVWVKRRVLGDGTFYFGCYGYNSSSSNVGVIYNTDGTTNSTNPYFHARGWGTFSIDEWILVVGHIFPHTHTDTSNHVDSGYYDLNGNKIASITRDFRWRSDNARASHRTYLYYSTDPATHQLWCYPRVDICDGSEPAVQDLIAGINGEGDATNPLTNSNCTLTYDGVAIEEATTNLWSGNLIVYNNYGVPASLTKLDETYDGHPIYRLAMTVDDAHSSNLGNFQTALQSHGVYGSSITFLANTKYAASIIWRPVNKKDVVVGGTASNIGGFISRGNVSLGGEWFRYTQVRDGTVTEDKTGHVFHSFYCPSLQLNETIYIDWCCPQIEQARDFATSYIVGNRAAARLDLPKAVMDSLSFTVFMRLRLASLPASGNNMYFDAYPKLYIWRTTGSHYCSWADSAQRSLGFGTLPNQEEFNIAVTREYISPTDVITRTYYNGLLKDSYTSTSEPSMSMAYNYGDFIKLHGWGGSSPANSQIKQLSFYIRALSEDEINRLANESFKMTSTGNLITSDFSERPNSIPADAYYFPLDFEVKDEYKMVSPSTETNTVHEDGAVWVGTATTNILESQLDTSMQTKTGWASGATINDDGSLTFYPTNWYYLTSGSSGYCVGKIAAGNICSYQLEYFIPTGGIPSGTTSLAINIRMVKSDGSSINYMGVTIALDNIVLDKWTRVKYEKFTIPADFYSLALLAYFNNATTAGVVKIRRAQLEQKSFSVPFIAGTRGASDLEFNFNSSIGLDWSGNWSIIYWKKPTGTSNDTLTGYNIESLGCNSNSVGGGYTWWGKNSGSNTIASSSPSPMDPSKYFNDWRMISVVKSGTTITIKEWSPTEGIYTRTVSNSTTAANYYVTQYGYDFKFGWDNTQVSNTYYKDLIVVKRTLSDAEINEIYQTQMRSYKDRLQIQGQLREVAL